MTVPPTRDTTRDEEEYARLTLGGMGPMGDTLASYQGEQINVFGGIPGEQVVARIVRYRRRRRRQVSAVVTEVLEPSPHRVAAPCPYFGPCSGCQWQHIDYSYQLELKADSVWDMLRQAPELRHVQVQPTIASPQTLGYRNHARFTVRNQGTLGFVNRITRRFVRIDRCLLMAPWINQALGLLQGKCRETTQLSIRYGFNTGDWLIQPRLKSDEVPLKSGQTHYQEKIWGHSFRIASPSFFQVNTQQAEELVRLVRRRLQLTGEETLVDAYAGVGTFSAYLAPYARWVIAIEESAAAVEDASVNTRGIENLVFRQGRTEDVLAGLDESPDAVILDPPRAGCDSGALDALVRRRTGRIVYVSCDPETLARDLQVLVRGGYRVDSVEPLDMFPQTHHVECVVTLVVDDRSAGPGIEVESGEDDNLGGT